MHQPKRGEEISPNEGIRLNDELNNKFNFFQNSKQYLLKQYQ